MSSKSLPGYVVCLMVQLVMLPLLNTKLRLPWWAAVIKIQSQMTFIYSRPCLQCWHNIADAAVQSVLGRKFTQWNLTSVMGWLHQRESISVEHAFADPVLQSCQGLHMLSICFNITVSDVSKLSIRLWKCCYPMIGLSSKWISFLSCSMLCCWVLSNWRPIVVAADMDGPVQ